MQKRCEKLTKKKERQKKNHSTHTLKKKMPAVIALGKNNCISKKKKIFKRRKFFIFPSSRGGDTKTPNDVTGCKRNLPSSTQGKKQVFVPKY